VELDTLQHQLRRFALSRLGDPEAANDAVQDTFLAAMSSRAGFEGRSKLRTWLTAILRNKIADHQRAAARKRSVIVSEAERSDSLEGDDDGEASSCEAQHVDYLSDPGRILDARQVLVAVSRELGKLPPRGARALVMVDIEGRDTEEACDELGVSPNNLWVLLHRTRKALRGEMAAQFA
jgi:RNA polymerase sigma-70 factor (ECF subfamily)